MKRIDKLLCLFIAFVLIGTMASSIASASSISVVNLVQLTDDPYREMAPSWSPDGTKIAYANQKSSAWDDSQIWIMAADGTGKEQITDGNDGGPISWSPDGSQIAFTRCGGFWYDSYKANSDGTGVAPIAADPSLVETHPSWSPDGSKIAYVVRYGSPIAEIWVMDADGSNKKRLTTGRYDYFNSWSKDGKKILFSSKVNDDWDVWVMDADGSNQIKITDDPSVDDWCAKWSPDETMIVFASGSADTMTLNIYVMNSDGSGRTKLTNDDTSYGPDWSPDGKKIAFMSSRAGDYDIWVMELSFNEPPLADSGGPYGGFEGSEITFDGSSSSDDNAVVLYEWDFNNDGIFDFSSSEPYATYTWDDDYAGIVLLRVTDEEGLSDTATAEVTVNNVAPTPEAGADQNVAEGETVGFSGIFTDAGSVDTHTIEWDFGDGNAEAGTETTHVYADNGDYTVTLTVTDDDGGFGTDTLTVTVNNVAPEIVPFSVSPDPIAVGTTITVDADFTDPGDDTHTATLDWGDGNSDIIDPVNDNTINADHLYTTAGIYAVTLTVADDDGGSDTFTAEEYIVIYDPDGGFVTGGGWIESPVNAYVPDPGLTGKATFGFVSKYKKGATVPTGATQFNFQVADLNFHSDNYQWLVIAGSKAKYKGTGTINGEGNYGFMLTAIDGDIKEDGIDEFRIKIWEKDGDIDGDIVYDNGGDLEDGEEITTQLEGGSIRIHQDN